MGKYKITVGMGSCGIAAGAKPVYDKLNKLILEKIIRKSHWKKRVVSECVTRSRSLKLSIRKRDKNTLWWCNTGKGRKDIHRTY